MKHQPYLLPITIFWKFLPDKPAICCILNYQTSVTSQKKTKTAPCSEFVMKIPKTEKAK